MHIITPSIPCYRIHLFLCLCIRIYVFLTVFVFLFLYLSDCLSTMTSQCISLQRASHVIASQATSAHFTSASICWKSTLTTHITTVVETLPTPLHNTMHSASIASIGWRTRLMAVESHLRRHSKAIASVDRITICWNNTEEGASDHRMMQQCINFLDSLHHSATSEHVSVQNLAW